MAVEDGAILGELFHLLETATSDPSPDIHLHIPALLHLYETLRKSRTTLNGQGAMANPKLFHMSDGREQKARDRALRSTDWATPNKYNGLILAIRSQY